MSTNQSTSVKSVGLLIAAEVGEDAVPMVVSKLEAAGLTPTTCKLVMGDLESDVSVGMGLLEQGYQIETIIPTPWDDLSALPCSLGKRRNGSAFNKAAPAIRNNQMIAMCDHLVCVYPDGTEFSAIKVAWRAAKPIIVCKIQNVVEEM